MPKDPDYQLAWDPWHAIPKLRAFRPDAVHIATEGPLGMWANVWLRRRKLAFTTSFHTRFPEFLNARFGVSVDLGYRIESWFHAAATHTLVGTRSMIQELEARGVGRQLAHWPRGVDASRFSPKHRSAEVYRNLPGPIWLYVGRVAAEKSLEDFLSLKLEGTKVVVGDGPAREALERAFPDAVFRGFIYGEELSAHFASADYFVFPSRTDTFGNVILEALASGLPVASVKAPGPIDLVIEGFNGAIDDDLFLATRRAMRCSRGDARASVSGYTFEACHEVFRSHLVPLSRRLPPFESTPRVEPAYQPSAQAALT
jgi:glycosyltransferase involved in cell wall biosynthesis